ncbi:RNA polymerase factor sigma-54 [Rubrimonas cliftonensis]|uniref:RNA polymerase sigma-54 factor n=1 Tax=Rubrimonas cliftonensis TaxID=89524 RepID=A0A1H4A6H4_9RHOB|nr:RNA polymerase factor sigma-54 [Rubrimonas cliftonensis]SEA31490.1 RNA polymerase, sigma 54 subunit, RpoN/SigL [Rubrimonas cliftonensis]
MSMRQRLELRHAQQMVMTPQLRQAIAMLQMSTLELSSFLASEVERNPLLSLHDGSGDAERAPPTAGERPAVDAAIRRDDPGAVADFDTGRENLFEPDAAPPAPPPGPPAAGPGGSPGAGGRSDFEAFEGDGGMAAPVSLAEHLCAQLALARLSSAARATAEALAGELDEDGYLRVDLDDLAARLGAGPATMAAALAALRACEPTGVGAVSLAECLALQLAERDRLDPAMRALLDNLAALPGAPADRLAKLCGVDRDDLRDMLAELRALDPRPGLRFGGGHADLVTPEVLVSQDGFGGWRVEMNAEALPRLLVDRSYSARVRERAGPASGEKGREARLFLAECAQSASWLQRSLDQRARTILTVATEIVRTQAAFFEEGVSGLRPMTLRQVAEAVSVHESTVSRVTANKFMATPRGLYELKFFFTTALAASDGGAALSAEAVRERIRAMIAAETPGKPLSDDHIVAALKAEGVELARRTVAKYREAMRIPSSVDRRRRARAAL